MQNNWKEGITSHAASQNVMVNLVTQLLLNASQIILELAGIEKNESEFVSVFHYHPYLHRAGKQRRSIINNLETKPKLALLIV